MIVVWTIKTQKEKEKKKGRNSFLAKKVKGLLAPPTKE
jgi:hypothetical protein